MTKVSIKKILIISSIFIVTLAIISIMGGHYFITHKINQPVVPEDLDSYQFEVTQGQTVSEVLTSLENAGFINDTKYMRWYLEYNHDAFKSIQAGEYVLEPGLSVVEVLESFQGGTFQGQLVFLEGWRREEYAAYLVEEVGLEFGKQFYILSDGLEGQLFPDTYFIDDSVTPESLIATMQSTYQKRMKEAGLDVAASKRYSEKDLLILASIIEREVREDVDRAIVAGIFFKRLEEDWTLGADATTQYALANSIAGRVGFAQAVQNTDFVWWPKVLTIEDLEIESEYNTRQNKGLPPNPIANPGFASLQAVVNPIESEYYYYLTDLNGVTRYASTLEEHNRNIQQFGVLQY